MYGFTILTHTHTITSQACPLNSLAQAHAPMVVAGIAADLEAGSAADLCRVLGLNMGCFAITACVLLVYADL